MSLPIVRAQDAAALPPHWFYSYEMFQMMLEEKGLTVVPRLNDALSHPSRSVVLLFGDQSHLTRDEWLRMRRYVAQGGSLLVASEERIRIPGVCEVSGQTVSSADERVRYQMHSDCLVLDDLAADHPLTTGLRNIVVNRCGWLTEPVDESLTWSTVATIPNSCQPSSARGKPVLLCGLDEEQSQGVMLLSADRSLFSNGMLWHGDNSLLAIRIANLLCRGNRSNLFAMSNGNALPAYRQSTAMQPPVPPAIPPLPPGKLPQPDLATTLRALNRAVDKVQESNLLNEVLRDQPRNMRPLAWLRTVLLVLLLALLALLVRQFMRRRSQLPPLRQLRFMQSMFGVASANQIERSEFGSAVEVLARDVCTSLTGSAVETAWLKLNHDSHPLVSRLSRSERAGLLELVRMAVSGCREHISRRRFQAIGRLVSDLRRLSAGLPVPVPAAQSVQQPNVMAGVSG